MMLSPTGSHSNGTGAIDQLKGIGIELSQVWYHRRLNLLEKSSSFPKEQFDKLSEDCSNFRARLDAEVDLDKIHMLILEILHKYSQASDFNRAGNQARYPRGFAKDLTKYLARWKQAAEAVVLDSTAVD